MFSTKLSAGIPVGRIELNVLPQILNTKHGTTSNHEEDTRPILALLSAASSVTAVCAVVLSVISTRSMHRRVRVFTTHYIFTLVLRAHSASDY